MRSVRLGSASVLGGIVLAALTTLGARAADLGIRPQPASPYIPVQFYWTGFYVGGAVGGGWGTAGWTDGANPGNVNLSPAGFLVGGYTGVNYQIGPAVLGIEGTFDGNWFNDNATDVSGDNLKTQVFWTATITGRLGWAFDRLLVYGKGGAAFDYDRATETVVAPQTPAQVIGSSNRSGWTVGGGLEYAFTEHLLARVEYDYLWFPTKVVALSGSTGSIFGSTPVIFPGAISLNLSEVKAGMAYKF